MRNFRVLVKKLSYGNEIQFQVLRFGKNFTKDFNVKKFSIGIPCFMNKDQNEMEFLYFFKVVRKNELYENSL